MNTSDIPTTAPETAQHLVTPQCLILRYRYQKLLGEGSNGKTYLAIDKRNGAKVAIKALKIFQNDTYKSYELFKREAETLSSIQVRGVPKFYERILSPMPGSESYLIQEYIDAPSIQTYLEQGRRFTEDETRAIMLKICDILNDLHTQYSPPIIHRDIKPSNILCKLPETDDPKAWQELQPYLIDFGAVANASSNSDKSTIAGTVGYMAPEQNFGECLPQTDLYALGATALHMLTGKPPYEMDYETYSLKFEPYLDELAPDTSPQMRELLRALLSYTTNERPASAAELKQKLTDFTELHDVLPEAASTVSLSKRISQAIRNFTQRTAQKLSRAPDPHTFMHELIDVPATGSTLPSNMKLAYGIFWPEIFTSEYAEYTFNANGKTWAGYSKYPILVSSAPSPLPPFTACPPPQLGGKLGLRDRCIQRREITYASCVVLYYPDDPSCNRLLYIFQPPKDAIPPQTSSEDASTIEKLIEDNSTIEMINELSQNLDAVSQYYTAKIRDIKQKLNKSFRQ